MDNNKSAPVKSVAYNYGIYLALTSIISLVILYLINEERNIFIGLGSFAVSIVIYYYGIATYKKLNSNNLRVRDALKSGMAIALVGGIISAIYTYIHYAYIQAEFLASKKQEVIDNMMEQNPDLEGEGLDLAIKMIDLTTSPFFASTLGIIFALFFGLIISLIIGAILKSN